MRIGFIYNVVYKSRCLYVGSTWNFKKRMDAHKSRCYKQNSIEYNNNLYKFIREHDVWEAFQFTIIDTIETDDSDADGGLYELLTAEQYYIDMLEPTLNGYDAILFPEERRRKKKASDRKLAQKNIDTKRYSCKPCGFVGAAQSNLDEHYTTKKHKNINN